MSEYQYYEFQSVDRALSQQEMAKLRALSTRATITPYRFVNVYNYGDFGGDPAKLMASYFDAFVYVANWGTYHFMLRLPRRLLALETAEPYFACEWTTARVAGDAVILEFLLDDEGDDDEKRFGWITDEQAAGWLPGFSRCVPNSPAGICVAFTSAGSSAPNAGCWTTRRLSRRFRQGSAGSLPHCARLRNSSGSTRR
jgi:hypothetical protein